MELICTERIDYDHLFFGKPIGLVRIVNSLGQHLICSSFSAKIAVYQLIHLP